MVPTLPQQDPEPGARAARLAHARERLRYAYDQPPGIAMAAEVPKGQGYALPVVAKVAALSAAMKLNRAAARAPGHRSRAPSTLASCRSLFATIGPPALAAIEPGSARADLAFAWQRVAGANPFVLEAIDRLPESFPVSAADFGATADAGDSLDAARAEGRLFLARYDLLEGIPTGTGDGAPKYLAAPMALFVQRRGAGLWPVAIQCAPRPAPDAPVLTPRDGVAWQMARVVVQVADGNLQEIVHHLGRAHFLVEAFAMATERQLAAAHPIAVLLAPHFEGTLAINDGARTQLCAAGGQLEELLAPTREASLDLARRAIASFRLEDALPPADLARRRVDDPSLLPTFPYRDDALLVWSAVHAFITDYLALYYPDDAAVAADTELRAWVDELRADDGGRVKGFPARLETRAALADALAWLVFTASAQHAALNYAQFEMMAYAPNLPAAGYAPAPVRDPSLDADAAWSRMLPSDALAADQLDFFYQQSNVRENQLGRYRHGHFEARVAPLVERFSAGLADAERVIAERNRARFMPYPWLVPSSITASIHI